jgi:hypothetical protein
MVNIAHFSRHAAGGGVEALDTAQDYSAGPTIDLNSPSGSACGNALVFSPTG